MDKVQFNTEVVNMRKLVKRVKVLTVQNLTRQVAKIRKKKGSEQQVLKNQRRAARYLAEIEAMKDLTPDAVTRKAVTFEKGLQQVLNHPKSSATDRVLARMIHHKLVQERAVKFKDMVTKDLMRMGTKKYRHLRKERFQSQAQARWKAEENYQESLEKMITKKKVTRDEDEDGDSSGDEEESGTEDDNFVGKMSRGVKRREDGQDMLDKTMPRKKMTLNEDERGDSSGDKERSDNNKDILEKMRGPKRRECYLEKMIMRKKMTQDEDENGDSSGDAEGSDNDDEDRDDDDIEEKRKTQDNNDKDDEDAATSLDENQSDNSYEDILEKMMRDQTNQSSDEDELDRKTANRGRYFDDLVHRGRQKLIQQKQESDKDSNDEANSDNIPSRRDRTSHVTGRRRQGFESMFMGKLSAMGDDDDDDDDDDDEDITKHLSTKSTERLKGRQSTEKTPRHQSRIEPTLQGRLPKTPGLGETQHPIGYRRGERPSGPSKRKVRKIPMVDQPNLVRKSSGEKQIPGINCHPDLPLRTDKHREQTRKPNSSRPQSKQPPVSRMSTNQSRQRTFPSQAVNPTSATKSSPVKPGAPETLHPSWEASRKRKLESKILPFQGKKITFDDD